MTKMYRKQIIEEKKRELIKCITRKMGGVLSKKEIEGIINHKDLDLEYMVKNQIRLNIQVVSGRDTIAKCLTLTSITNEHSWAGSDGIEETGHILYGDCEFGEYTHESYSDNGNVEDYPPSKKLPEFDICKPLAIYTICERWCDWINNSGNFRNIEHNLIFYKPDRKEFTTRAESGRK